MEIIEKFDNSMNTIHWEGTGTYVAIKYRGPRTYHKLPNGKTPLDDVEVREFSEKPKHYIPQEKSNGLWK